nr:MAG TPA: hypothetical protein [Caudoviricetes sp.]
MEIRKVSDSISIYSDGKRLQVIHDLGDEFILDISSKYSTTYNVDNFAQFMDMELEPVFKICGFCSKAGEDMHRLRWAILQFEEFKRYIKTNQDDLMGWWSNPGRKVND